MKFIHMPDGRVKPAYKQRPAPNRYPDGKPMTPKPEPSPDYGGMSSRDYRRLFEGGAEEAEEVGYTRWEMVGAFIVGAALGIAGLVLALGLPLPLR